MSHKKKKKGKISPFICIYINTHIYVCLSPPERCFHNSPVMKLAIVLAECLEGTSELGLGHLIMGKA